MKEHSFVLASLICLLFLCVCVPLVAPYCAIPRDYLSDTALLRAMGFFVSQHGHAIPPSPFSRRFPLGEHAKWRCDTPPLQSGISAIRARYPMKARQMGAMPPSAILSRKGISRYGGVSRSGPPSVSPCVAKTCVVRPVYARVVVELGAAEPSIGSKEQGRKCLFRGTI